MTAKLDDAAKIWREFAAVEDKPRPTMVYADRLTIIESIQDQALEVAAQKALEICGPAFQVGDHIRRLKNKQEPTVDRHGVVAGLELARSNLHRNGWSASDHNELSDMIARYKRQICTQESTAHDVPIPNKT